MIDVTPEYMLNFMDIESLRKVWRGMRGTRVYFPVCKSVHEEIREIYKLMRTERADAVKQLAALYEMSESQIRRIVREQGELFEED